jgi:hypothetical protein
MSKAYQGRHRNVPTHGRRASRGSSGLTKTIRRPAVTSSVLLAVIATTAAGYQAADERQTGAAAFTVSTEAIAQANELADAQIEDTARLAADRNEKARQALEAKKQALLANAQADPRAAARALLPEFGFSDSQWGCLNDLWMGESGWRYTAENSSSGAYGIPQSLPGSKMATIASDWRTNPVTQIRWGLQYIKGSYGTPCGAWDAWQSRSPHWY